MNYININHNGIDEKLEIIESNKFDVSMKFENSEDIIIITKDDLINLIGENRHD